MAKATKKAVTTNKQKKLCVLDTNVLMHDPAALNQFEENDIFICLETVEELDRNKKGMTDPARNARQTSRFLDKKMLEEYPTLTAEPGLGYAYPLGKENSGQGRLVIQKFRDEELDKQIAGYESLATSGDNMILAVTSALRDKWKDRPNGYRDVVFVSKDVNARIKAKSLGLQVEDYKNDRVASDADHLPTGLILLPDAGQECLPMQNDRDRLVYPIPKTATLYRNIFIHDGNGFSARVYDIVGDKATLLRTRNFMTKATVMRMHARNREQSYGFDLLTDPTIEAVTLLGPAGTGKTFLAVAAGLEGLLDDQLYDQIVMTRITVPIGEDIGFLPGTEEEKMNAWMGALDDNLDMIAANQEPPPGGPTVENLQKKFGKGAKSNISQPAEQQVTSTAYRDFLRSKIKVRSISFMRGRSFTRKFVIVDEAQNLTPKQVKALITRTGPGSKMIFMGNLAQIDTPYLTEHTSGLAYLVDKFHGQKEYGNIILREVVRSRIAELAEELL